MNAEMNEDAQVELGGLVGHENGFSSVMSVGLAEKYGRFQLMRYRLLESISHTKADGENVNKVVVADWGRMVGKVVDARNDGLLDDGEMMGILWLYTHVIHDEFIEFAEKETNRRVEI